MEDFKKTLELHRIQGDDNNKNDEINRKRRRAIFVVETVENAQPAEEAGSCIRYFNKLRKALKSSEEEIKQQNCRSMRTMHLSMP